MTHLIDKDALVAEIERRIEEGEEVIKQVPSSAIIGLVQAYKNILSFLDTLEVKEIGNNLWKSANSDNLPEIDREVVALLEDGMVVFAHRPPEYWDGRNIITNKVTRYEPKRYDKGGWNQPNVKWWLDLELPKIEE